MKSIGDDKSDGVGLLLFDEPRYAVPTGDSGVGNDCYSISASLDPTAEHGQYSEITTNINV